MKPGMIRCAREYPSVGASWGWGSILHQAKSKVIGPCARLAFAAPTRHVTRTILICAQERAAAMDLFRQARLRGIKALPRPCGIYRGRSTVRQRLVVVRPIPIRRPLPNVTGHVIESIPIGRERSHRRCASGSHPQPCCDRGSSLGMYLPCTLPAGLNSLPHA